MFRINNNAQQVLDLKNICDFLSLQVDVRVCVVLCWAIMECVCLGRWTSGSAVVFLHTLALSWTGKKHGSFSPDFICRTNYDLDSSLVIADRCH